METLTKIKVNDSLCFSIIIKDNEIGKVKYALLSSPGPVLVIPVK